MRTLYTPPDEQQQQAKTANRLKRLRLQRDRLATKVAVNEAKLESLAAEFGAK